MLEMNNVLAYHHNATQHFFIRFLTFSMMGSGCGSDGRAVASYIRGLRFESSQQQILYVDSVNCIEKTKIN